MNRKWLLIIVLLPICAAVVWWVLPRASQGFRPTAIIVHESASRWGDVISIRQWHRDRGWYDIGYHAVILNGHRSKRSGYDPHLDGKIELGRREIWPGAHCEGEDMNSKSLGVCLVGTPGRGGYPTKHQIDALVHYCAVKCRQYDIPSSAITQHSDHDRRKPLCASLNMAVVRHKVEAALRTSSL